MKIQRIDTVTNKEKEVLFQDVVKNCKGRLSNVAVTYQLLDNRVLKNGRFEFRRKVN